MAQMSAEMEKLTNERDVLTTELIALKNDIEAAHLKLNQAKKSLDLVELEHKVLKEKRKEREAKLEEATSPKQFMSLEQEIKDIRMKSSALEDQGLVLLSEVEKAQEAYDILKKTEADRVTAKETKIDETEKRIKHLKELSDAYVQQRTEAAQSVDPELFKKYESMKEKVSNPAVPLLNNSCSACFYSVSHPQLIEAQQGKLITCKDCYRLLYTYNKNDKREESV